MLGSLVDFRKDEMKVYFNIFQFFKAILNFANSAIHINFLLKAMVFYIK